MVFHIGSGAVAWSAKKQEIIALSTTEAEYIAATSAACQAVWMRRVLEDCGETQHDATILWCDNRSAISLGKNPIHHSRTKHIDIRFHFIRNLIAEKVISLEHCSTENQLADIFTKALPVKKHMFIMTKLGLLEPQSREGVKGSEVIESHVKFGS